VTLASLSHCARKDRLINERVLAARLSRSPLRFLFYLYWRNRFQVFTKAYSRILILIEIALLFHYFHSAIAASVSFVLFLIVVLISMFQGVIQSARIDLVQSKGSGGDASAILGVYTIVLLVGSWLTLSIAEASLIAWSFEQSQIAFLTLGFVIVPLTLIEHLLWNAVYTYRRLRRSLTVILLARAAPIMALVLFHNLLGPIAYGLGMLLGRAVESSYLILVARNALRRAGKAPVFNQHTVAAIPRYLLRRSFWEYAGISVPAQLYQVGVGALLLTRDHSLWAIYFAFLQLLALAEYLSLRPVYSLGMDLYLSAGAQFSRGFRRFRRVAFLFTWVTIGVVVGLTVAAVLLVPTYLAFLLKDLLLLLPWFVLLLIAQTFHMANLSIHRRLGTDRSYLWPLTILFLIVGLPAQWYLVHELRGNLPAVLVCDLILSIAAACILSRSTVLKSPVFQNGSQIASRTPKLSGLSELCIRASNECKPLNLCLFAMAGKRAAAQWQYIVEEMQREVGAVAAVQIGSGSYCLLLSAESAVTALRTLQGKFGGYLAASTLLPLGIATPTPWPEINRALKRVLDSRNLVRPLRDLVLRVERARRSGNMDLVTELLTSGPEAQQMKLLSERLGIANCPRVVAHNDGEHFLGGASQNLEFVRFVERELANAEDPETVIRWASGPYVVFAVLGQAKLIVDTTALVASDRERVKDASVAFAFVLSFRALYQ